ncbi:hypothetical protein GQ42DRAFT_160832 [Ramicandelaber brevisporus]|nr:hypothetical protein GQ42DRAFT_160832 [Ramicandelaber brevisporus]
MATATRGTSADSQRNHLHLMTTNDQRQQARGGGESQRKRGRTTREGGGQMEHAAGKTRMPATPTWRQRDNHHWDRTPRQHTPAPGDNEGTTPGA